MPYKLCDTCDHVKVVDNNIFSKNNEDWSIFPHHIPILGRTNGSQKVSINLGKKQTNFTTNGLDPFLRCPQCFMKFDCSNYPYEIDDVNKTLCTTCVDKNNDPFKVLGKQPGRPRNCQILYN